MIRSLWVVGIATLAFGCTSKLEPIGSVGGSAGEAGEGGSAGHAGAPFPPDASVAGEGGSAGHAGDGYAGFGGYAGAPFLDGGYAGFGGHAGAPFPTDASIAGQGGYAGDGYAGFGGHAGAPFPTDASIAGQGGYAGDGYAGFGGHAGAPFLDGGYAGIGGYSGSGGYAGDGYAGSGGYGGCGEFGPDDDGDGYSPTICSGDCDDNDEDAFPYQTSFFTTHRESGGFDFDCDGQVTLRWGQSHTVCRLDPTGQTCLGSGWVSDDGSLPGCGRGGSYAFCEFTGVGCAISMHEVVQACR